MNLKQRAWAVPALALFVLCLVGAGVIWKAERSLRGSERSVASGESLGVSVHPLAPVANPGFEEFSAPSGFRSAALFRGKFYLSGPAGLFAYANSGILEHSWRVGLDLPAAPLGQMAVGTLSDSHQPELLISTAGEGVLAFDGQRFRQIRATDAESRKVTTLLPMASGRLLIGTAKRGLLVYDGSALHPFHSTTNDLYVTALAGSEAELWIGTLNRGLLHWRGGQVETIAEADGLPDPRVEAISLADDPAGDVVYVGTPDGVAEIRDGKVVRVRAQGRYARAVLAGSDELLVGQIDGGVLNVSLHGRPDGNPLRRPISIQPISIQSTRAAQPEDLNHIRQSAGVDEPVKAQIGAPMHTPIAQLLQAGDARYALSSDRLMLQQPDGGWQSVLAGSQAQLADRNVSSLMVASDGRLWIGYFDRGLDILPAAGGHPIHVENDQVFCVNRIVENQPQNAIAVATANGLVLFDRDGRQRQVLTRDSGLIASHVTDIALYGDGMVAATPQGITFLDSSGAHSIYAFEGLVNNHVYALGVRGQALLVGTLGGLSIVNDGAVKQNLTTANSGLKANWITALVPTSDGWLAGTYGAGVLHLNASLDANRTANPAAGSSVTAINATDPMNGQDSATNHAVINPGAMLTDGRLILAGTLGQGLLVSDASGMRWKTVTAGLPSLNVTALAVHQGIVYVGTDNGLVRIAEDKL